MANCIGCISRRRLTGMARAKSAARFWYSVASSDRSASNGKMNFVLEKFIFPFEALLSLEATEYQNRAADFALAIPVRRRLDMHPMQLAILSLYFDFKTFSLSEN